MSKIPRRMIFDSDERTKVQPCNKKCSKERLYTLVLDYLQENHKTGDKVYAESISLFLKTKPHYIKQIFHKLNLEGKLSKALFDYGGMYCRDDMWGDSVLQWAAKCYILLEGLCDEQR